MSFNSIEYLCFYLLILLVSWAIVGLPKLRIWILLLASYYFYTSNNHWLIFLILISTQIDYFCAIKIEDASSPKIRKRFLLLSVVTNLGILGFFKYFNFFGSSIIGLSSSLGWHISWIDLNIALPVGISFYTFQSMSYTIDVYRRVLKAERSWVRFSFFVAYFPQLVAGPIVRPSCFLPQLDKKPKLRRGNLELALLLIFQGLFKKIVLGDFLGVYADNAFNNSAHIGIWGAWLGMYAFAFQIYFDFSGYSDIAIGCSKLMGFNLPENFRRPYIALNITDFWRRWHISLSTWLRDYLYIPLGGNRMKNNTGVYRNLMITMLLGGLWHGAAWHFVLWGFMHGLFLIVERAFKISGKIKKSAPFKRITLIKIFITFNLVCFSWVVFRADDNTVLLNMFRSLTTYTQLENITWGMVTALVIIVLGGLTQIIMEFKRRTRIFFLRLPIPIKSLVYVLVIILVTVLGSTISKPFIYFRF